MSMPNPDSPTTRPPRFSLIVSTRDRLPELENFLTHLESQTWQDFEILVTDQSSGDGVSALLQRHAFRQKYLRSDQVGLANGRNAGLQLAQGDIFAIPDDDCWYPTDLLETVAQWFDAHPGIDMLCVVECNPQGDPMVPQKPPPAGLCTDQAIGLSMKRSVWLAQSSMVFMRREVRDAIGGFDQSIGVGSGNKYQSGEETDYFLRAMHAGFTMWFEPSIRVFHPELRELRRIRKTNYPYSVGNGHLLRKHGCGLPLLLAVACRSFGGAIVSALRGKFDYVPIYLRRGVGILVGYFGL